MIIRNIITPVITAVIVGVGASFLSTKVALAVTGTKIVYIEAEVNELKNLLSAIRDNQLELAKHAQRMKFTDQEILLIRSEIKVINKQYKILDSQLSKMQILTEERGRK